MKGHQDIKGVTLYDHLNQFLFQLSQKNDNKHSQCTKYIYLDRIGIFWTIIRFHETKQILLFITKVWSRSQQINRCTCEFCLMVSNGWKLDQKFNWNFYAVYNLEFCEWRTRIRNSRSRIWRGWKLSDLFKYQKTSCISIMIET